jgi:hypothetical protein
MQEQGFHIIVCVVGSDNPNCPALGGGVLQKGIAQASGRLFKPLSLALCRSFHIALTYHEGNLLPSAILLHKVNIPGGLLPSKLMVIVGGHQREAHRLL